MNVGSEKLLDNIYGDNDTPRQSIFSRYAFTTNAGKIRPYCTTDLFLSFPNWCQLGVRVDGVENSTLDCSKNGKNVFQVDLGNPGVSKDVEIVMGLQSTGGGGTTKGTFIDAVHYPNDSTFSESGESPVDRIVVYGDSIAAGGNSDDPPHDSWPVLLRTTYDRDVLVEAWGYRALKDDADTAAKRTAFATHLLSSSPARIYFAIGTNDFGLSKWSASDFGTALSALLDEIHAQDGSVSIDVQCPTYRTDEATLNSFGDDLDDYRSAESSACSGRGWATYYDASTILDGDDLDDDVHPTIAGHAKYALAVDTYLDL